MSNGHEIISSNTTWVEPFGTIDVPAEPRIHIPEGHCALVTSRSGRGWSTHIEMMNDGDSYKLSVTFTNLWPIPRCIKKGKNLAQLIFVPAYTEITKAMLR